MRRFNLTSRNGYGSAAVGSMRRSPGAVVTALFVLALLDLREVDPGEVDLREIDFREIDVVLEGRFCAAPLISAVSRASVRNPSAPRPLAMNTSPVPGRWS